jgi:hypothetical protein
MIGSGTPSSQRSTPLPKPHVSPPVDGRLRLDQGKSSDPGTKETLPTSWSIA